MNDFSQGYLIEGYTRVTTKTHDGTKSSSMHTQIFKERNGMTGPTFILKNKTPVEKQLKPTIHHKFLALSQYMGSQKLLFNVLKSH